jgi:hypothetical protein
MVLNIIHILPYSDKTDLLPTVSVSGAEVGRAIKHPIHSVYLSVSIFIHVTRLFVSLSD